MSEVVEVAEDDSSTESIADKVADTMNQEVVTLTGVRINVSHLVLTAVLALVLK